MAQMMVDPVEPARCVLGGQRTELRWDLLKRPMEREFSVGAAPISFNDFVRKLGVLSAHLRVYRESDAFDIAPLSSRLIEAILD